MKQSQELNLCKLLKEHVGITLYSPICGMTRLRNIDENAIYPIKTMDYNYLKDGRLARDSQGRCQLFPSEELYLQYPTDPYAAWTKWADENKKVTYEDVRKELFKEGAWQPMDGRNMFIFENNANEIYMINGTSKKQLEKLIAINKLMNVQKYIEKGWQPDWNDDNLQWTIFLAPDNEMIPHPCFNAGGVYFSSDENVQKAIEILGEETIRTALSTDW